MILLAALLLVSPLFQAAEAAPGDISRSRQTRSIAVPIKHYGIAIEPPSGAKRTEAIRFDTSLRWKTNPSTRTIFTIDAERRLWFIDPTSGWPYTLDGKGNAYTANARTGEVYSAGNLALWPGNIPYFFANWSLVGGVYTLASLDLYLSIYANPAIDFLPYGNTYGEIWDYQHYFESSDFSSQTMSLESAADPATASHGIDGLGVHNDTGTIGHEGMGNLDFGGDSDFGGGADFGGGDVGGVE